MLPLDWNWRTPFRRRTLLGCFVLFYTCFSMGCGQRHLRKVSQFSEDPTPSDLNKLLLSKHSYIRLNTLETLHSPKLQASLSQFQTAEITQTLLTLLETPTEWCPIRGHAAYALGILDVVDSAEAIVNSLQLCDDESRFWMLLGLEELAPISNIAKGAIVELSQDTDIFIRNEALRWMEAE